MKSQYMIFVALVLLKMNLRGGFEFEHYLLKFESENPSFIM
jgi:hypothetical protein